MKQIDQLESGHWQNPELEEIYQQGWLNGNTFGLQSGGDCLKSCQSQLLF
jgi:hypothetical protein